MQRLFEITWKYCGGNEIHETVKAENIYSAVQIAHAINDVLIKKLNHRISGFDVKPIEE